MELSSSPLSSKPETLYRESQRGCRRRKQPDNQRKQLPNRINPVGLNGYKSGFVSSRDFKIDGGEEKRASSSSFFVFVLLLRLHESPQNDSLPVHHYSILPFYPYTLLSFFFLFICFTLSTKTHNLPRFYL